MEPGETFEELELNNFFTFCPQGETAVCFLQIGECCGEEVFTSRLVEVVEHLIEEDVLEEDDDDREPTWILSCKPR